MKLNMNRLIAVALIALLSGCSSTGVPKSDGSGVVVEDRGTVLGGGAGGTGGAVTSGAAGATDFSAAALNDPNSLLSRRVIYFEYDSAEVTADSQEILVAHAAYLAANSDAIMALEGHTDERGSREYNIALGDRRADSVRRLLELNGAPYRQITTISYGEEKPAAEGQSETAWRLNRRVQIVY
jgi:peptidoglycan-associated lipoprotein